jgi:NitT/TauT family transport system substrate-binding protein
MSGRDASPTPGRGSTQRVLAAVLALVAALTIGACGGGDEQEAGGGGDEGKPVTLTVGVLPIADLAPLYLGMDQGYFKAEKLTIKPAVAEGGAAIVPAVMSGDNQIGFSNVTSLMLAQEQNLPIKPLAAGVSGAASEDEAWDALLAPKGGAADLKQLAGKKVAVNTLKNLPEVAVRNSLEQAGVDPSKVQFVEIPFPDVPAALESKRVDAAFAVEPFVGASLAAGAKKLATPFEEVAPDLTIAQYFTSEKYAQENPDVVERFKRAMNKSLEYASNNPDEVRRIITTYTKTPKDVAEKMTLPKWSAEVNADAMNTLVELSKKYGVLKGDVDVDTFVNLN